MPFRAARATGHFGTLSAGHFGTLFEGLDLARDGALKLKLAWPIIVQYYSYGKNNFILIKA